MRLWGDDAIMAYPFSELVMAKQGKVQAVNINDLKRYAPEARVNQPLLDSKDLVTRMNCTSRADTPLHMHPDDDRGGVLPSKAGGR